MSLLCLFLIYLFAGIRREEDYAAMLDPDTVRQRINARFEKLFHITETGEAKPYVCLCCDSFLKPEELQVLSVEELKEGRSALQQKAWNRVPSALAACYVYDGNCGDYDQDRDWMQELLLSPRACFIRPENGSRKSGFSVCARCKAAVRRKETPLYAIANGYCVGNPPPCLLALTEVELAMLTPVKTFGYVFGYRGGIHKKLQGSLSYYKVQIQSIARTAMHFDVLGLHSNIVVVLYGSMTPEQRRRAREKNKIRVDHFLTALQWLLENHEDWKRQNINLDEVRAKLQNPTLIDDSRVDGREGDSNIESEETFKVFFPDGSQTSLNGGQASIKEFRQLISEAVSNHNYRLEFEADLAKEGVADYRDNNLVNACLLQFPYGRGGMHEQRLQTNGSFTTGTDIDDYVQHLTRLSQPQFHYDLFTLVLYNLNVKQQMVRSAGLKSRYKAHAEAFSEELTIETIAEAINRHHRGGGNDPASHFLRAVDYITRTVPHTDEAAKSARREAEALLHYFGLPSFFLTVTPDDDNSFLVLMLADADVDTEAPVDWLEDSSLQSRAKKRTELRLKIPGICAFFYELMVEIVIEECIGWDLKKGEPREEGGLFGIPQAFTLSTEEQGRTTLHMHSLIWVKEVQETRNMLFSTDRVQKREAEKKMCDSIDRVGSSQLFDTKKFNHTKDIAKAFPPDCTVPERVRRAPAVVPDQQLRNLRHKEGQKNEGGMFAFCPHCAKFWTNTEFVGSYLMHGVKVPRLTSYPDHKTRRLKASAMEYQKSQPGEDPMDSSIVNAAYNHHIHANPSCFGKGQTMRSDRGKKKGNEKEKRKHGNNYECRYRTPQRKRARTSVVNASDTPIPWYLWDGSFSERHVKEILIRRHQYDAFQNVCCLAISQSKMTCNTNVANLMPGPSGQYNFKYNFKDTQKEDTEEYGRVKAAMEKTLAALREVQSFRSESVKRLLGASFAHQKTNVVGAPMAAYLTRHRSRFIFSHKTEWCPVRDIIKLLVGGEVNATIQYSGGTPFFVSYALHYLCRPAELETLDAHDFYSLYEVVRRNSQNEEALLPFHNHAFQHPSYRPRTGRFFQGVRKRKVMHLIKIIQYDFPDTASFGGSILADTTPITEQTETYSMLALLLFYPYRTLEDIRPQGSYTLRFRQAFHEGRIGTKARNFLQNVQDSKSNCFRHKCQEDDLQRVTEPFLPPEEALARLRESAESEENDNYLQGPELEELLNLLQAETQESDHNGGTAGTESSFPESLNCKQIRMKGELECGYEKLARMKPKFDESRPVFETSPAEPEDLQPPSNDGVGNDGANSGGEERPSQRLPNRSDLVTIMLTKTTRKCRTFEHITKKKDEVRVLPANGSIDSILDWPRKAGLDDRQCRAFEIFAATFVLTFYKDAETGCSRTETLKFRKQRTLLRTLADKTRRQSDQLICLMHGPGGCGKTTVIDLVVEYAREYCSYMEGYEFTSKTIRVTAMTGVAATILLGETIHSAAYLNQRNPLTEKQVDAWEDTRLLIVDEVSFASKEDFATLNQRLRRLKQRLDDRYGGLHVIFAGDFRQLEPFGEGKKAVYKENCIEFKDWVNCFIELEGMHRFDDDPEWGLLLLRLRDGTLTLDDIDEINKRVVTDNVDIPDDMRYATYKNCERDSINTALFEERCKYMYETYGHTKDCFMVFSDHLEARLSKSTYTPFLNRRTFWEDCGEDDLEPLQYTHRMDPVLRLYQDCRVMLPSNSDVNAGLAKGTQATFNRLVLKPGVTPRTVKIADGIPVNAVYASEVEHAEFTHENDRIDPALFSIKPKQNTFDAKILKPEALRTKKSPREKIRMRAIQLPVLINNATTGHKLQGAGVKQIFVQRWTYTTNWPYVMLSRVKTRAGLFLLVELKRKLSEYAVPASLTRMLDRFRADATPTYWNANQYNDLFSGDWYYL